MRGERLHAEPLGRVVPGRDQVDPELLRGREAGLLGLAGEERVEPLVGCPDQVVPCCTRRDGEALDPIRAACGRRAAPARRRPRPGPSAPRSRAHRRRRRARRCRTGRPATRRSSRRAARHCRASRARRGRGGRRASDASARKRASSRPRWRRSTTSGSLRQKSPWWTSTMSAPTSAACSNSARELETPHSEQRHVVVADDLEAGRCELRPALHLEQRVRVGDDLVPPGHGHSVWAWRRRPTSWSGYPVGARGVAQPGSALRSGRRGPQFESGHPDCVRRSRIPSADPGSRAIPEVGTYGSLRPPFLKPGWSPAPAGECRVARRVGRRDAVHAGGYPRPVLRAVLFDVDFTLSRPGPELGPEAYRAGRGRSRARARPGPLRGGAARRLRGSAGATPSSSTTRRSGSRSPRTSSAAWEVTPTAPGRARPTWCARWEIHANFHLYDDARAGARRASRPRAARSA